VTAPSDAYEVRSLVARSVGLGRFGFGFGVLWCIGRSWSEANGTGLGGPWPAYLAGAAVFAALCVRSIRAARRLDRSAVEVSDEERVWGTVFQERRTRLPMNEVHSVRSGGLAALVLETRDGREVRMDTYEVDPDERPGVRRAIERRIGRGRAPQ